MPGGGIVLLAVLLGVALVSPSGAAIARGKPSTGGPFGPSHAGTGVVRGSGAHLPARISPGLGAPTLSWWNITSESNLSPPIDWFTEATWDAADGYLVSYGGDNFVSTNLNATQTFEGGNWALPKTGGVSPGPLDGPALAYDPASGQVVMYGGYASYSPFVYTNATFTYSAGGWSSAHLNPSPPAPTAASMVYDADLGGVVLFGGYNNSVPSGTSLLDDLWVYKGGEWTALPDMNPPSARTWASVAYDPGRHELVLYGGVTASYSCLGDTWTYNGTWSHVLTASGPSPLFGTELVYDPDLGGAVLLGGETCKGVANHQIWTFNGTGWQPITPAGSPSTHFYGLSAWDPVDQLLVVSEGLQSGSYTDVLSSPLRVEDLSGPRASQTGLGLTFNATAAGGVPLRNFSWDWGDGTPDAFGPRATHTYALSGQFTLNLTVTDSAGQTAYSNQTESVSQGMVAVARACSGTLDVGENCTFSAGSSGGVGAISYTWNSGTDTATGRTAVFSFSTVGNHSVSVTAMDATGSTGTAQVIVRVVPAMVVHLVGNGDGEVGVGSLFSASVTGGDPPVRFTWQVDNGTASTGPTLKNVFTEEGANLVKLTATDAANATTNQSLWVDVIGAFSVALAGPGSLPVGVNGSWGATVNGGWGPLVIDWSFSDGFTDHGFQTTHSFSSPGVYQLNVSVDDALNGTWESTLNLTVTRSNPGGSAASGLSLADGVGVGIVLVGAVVVGSVVWIRRPRDPPSS